MNLFSKAGAHIPGLRSNRTPYLEGYNEGFLRLVSAVRSTTQKTEKQQDIFTFEPIALAPNSEAVIGKNYIYRYCESEVGGLDFLHGIYLGIIAAVAGLPADPLGMAAGLGVQTEDLELDEEGKNEVPWAMFRDRMNKALSVLVGKMFAGEGTAYAGNIVEVKSKRKTTQSGKEITAANYTTVDADGLSADRKSFIPAAVAALQAESFSLHPDVAPAA